VKMSTAPSKSNVSNIEGFGVVDSMSDRFVGMALTLGFLVLISIVGGVGYLGLRAMDGVHGAAQSIAMTEWRDVQLASEALEYSSQNGRINMQLAAATDQQKIQLLLSLREENNSRISSILAELQFRIGSKKEQELYDGVVEARGEYVESYRHATQLLLTQTTAKEGQTWLLQTTLPLLSKNDIAWSNYVEFQKDEMNGRLRDSEVRYFAARRRGMYLVGLSILLAICIAVFVVRRIVVDVQRRQEAETFIRKLNQDLELKVLQRTAALEETNQDLSIEIAERKEAEAQLLSKTTFLEAQANSTIDGILVVDSNNRVILSNRRFEELFEFPQEVLESKNDEAALQHVVNKTKNPVQFLEKVRYLYDHKGETSRDEIEFLNGTVLDRYSSPVIDDAGTYYGRIWTFRDITQRKHHEDTLRQLSMAVEQSPVHIVITDPQGAISYVNRKFTECTGYSLDEIRGRRPSALKSGHTSPESYKHLWDTITHGGEWRGEFHNRKKNGDLYWESAVITPIKDANGTIAHFIAVKEEITERKAMETQLRQAQKLEAIGQLAAGIAHEINTPAQYVGDNVTFLKESWEAIVTFLSKVRQMRTDTTNDSLSPQAMDQFDHGWDAADMEYLQVEVPRAIDQSLEGIQRVTKIVRAMKDFSHPGSEEKKAIDINKAIETTMTVARNEWKYVADVETHFDTSLPSVPCHAGEFNQVILNLLVNSSHAIAQVVGSGGSSKGTITVSTRCDGDCVEVAIRDTGAGIPILAQPRIFEPFFTTKPVGKGTGQGLALAHNTIVRRHGGKIWFETEEGKGTTFFIRLPLSEPTPPEEAC